MQIVVGEETVTFGVVNTVIALVAVPVHPFAAVPVTEYVVVTVGLTVTEVPFKLPGCQLYVDAPPPVIVTEEPLQIVTVLAVAVTVGEVFTVIITVLLAVHPLADVPVTEYVVVLVGETVTLLPLSEPGIHE